ncbi:AMP-binding protein, partial [Planobispora takensis]
ELSYAGLDGRAGALAGALADLGVGPERCVAVLVPRSVASVVALVGVVKAAGAYVPIDPAYPAERVGFIVQDAAPMAVVTVAGLVDRVPVGLPVVVLDEDGELSSVRPSTVPASDALPSGAGTAGEASAGSPPSPAEPAGSSAGTGRPGEISAAPRSPLATPADPLPGAGTASSGDGGDRRRGTAGAGVAGRLLPEHPAYVIFTSGSTGRPKGVVVSHASVIRLLDATQEWFDFGPDDVWTLFHSYAFDFSVWELWGALLTGGRLVVVPFEVSRSPQEFVQL